MKQMTASSEIHNNSSQDSSYTHAHNHLLLAPHNDTKMKEDYLTKSEYDDNISVEHKNSLTASTETLLPLNNDVNIKNITETSSSDGDGKKKTNLVTCDDKIIGCSSRIQLPLEDKLEVDNQYVAVSDKYLKNETLITCDEFPVSTASLPSLKEETDTAGKQDLITSATPDGGKMSTNIYQCSKCNFSTRKRKKFRAHWTLHEDKKFHCEMCEKEFVNLGTLKRHQLTHTDRKYYLCDLCGRGYLHSISLKYHKLGHLKHNPIAGERTKSIQEKKNRVADKNEDKARKFLCDLCGKVFKQAVSLKSHRLKHDQETGKVISSGNTAKTNYLSDFDYEEYLNKKRPGPKRKHPLVNEKKRFKCSECPYAAARSRDVVVHLRTHTGDRPFPCNICGKFFSKESAVERHKLIHNTQKDRVFSHNNTNSSNIFKKNALVCSEKTKNVPDLYPINKHFFDNGKSAENLKSGSFSNPNNFYNASEANKRNGDNHCQDFKNENKFIDETKLKYPYFDDSNVTNNSRLVSSFNGFTQNCLSGKESDHMGTSTKEWLVPNTNELSKNVHNAQHTVYQNYNDSNMVKEANKINGNNESRQKIKLKKDPRNNTLSDMYTKNNHLENVNNSQSSPFQQQTRVLNTNIPNSLIDNDVLRQNISFSENCATSYNQDSSINNAVGDGLSAPTENHNNSDNRATNTSGNDKHLLTEKIHNTSNGFPHVIRLDGKEMRSSKRDKNVSKSKEKIATKKRVKGVKMKHKCEQCPYETLLSRDMRVHLRKHSGERPFPCPICGKRFTKESVVKRHQSVHTGLRPFSCEYCYKTFSQQSNLKIHKIAHFDITTGLLKSNIKKYQSDEGSMNENNCKIEEIVDMNFESKEEVVHIKQDIDDNLMTGPSQKTNKKKRKSDSHGRNIKKSKTKNKYKDIETINVDEIVVKNEIDFEFKIEYCSSDDESLSKVKETILTQNCGNNGHQPDCDIKVELMDVADHWENEEYYTEFKDEFKENLNQLDNIPVDVKNVVEESKTEADRLERKRRKKLKRKMKKNKRKRMETPQNVSEEDFVPKKINDGKKTIFKCDECHYSVVNKRDLIVHMRSHSGEKLFTCDICMKKFSKQSVVNRHKLIHFGIRPYTCHLCGLTFTQSNSLKKHVEIKHGLEEKDLPFKCDMCPATFAQEKSLKTHKHVHLRKKHNEFTCHVCGKVFPHECRLKSHLLLHNERQFNCMICSKKFLRKYDLKYHLLIHTQEKQCICHVCGGIFSTPATLKMHLRSHASSTQFACCVCGENFTTSVDLSQHRAAIHKGEKSFQCMMCDKFFSQASGLKKHQITHSTSRPHQCMVCWKRFKLLGHLHKHYNTTQHGVSNADNQHIDSSQSKPDVL